MLELPRHSLTIVDDDEFAARIARHPVDEDAQQSSCATLAIDELEAEPAHGSFDDGLPAHALAAAPCNMDRTKKMGWKESAHAVFLVKADCNCFFGHLQVSKPHPPLGTLRAQRVPESAPTFLPT